MCQSIKTATPVVEKVDLDARVAVVLGTQWGDEGKGKLVDILAQKYEIVARAQVSSSSSGLSAVTIPLVTLSAFEEGCHYLVPECILLVL